MSFAEISRKSGSTKLFFGFQRQLEARLPLRDDFLSASYRAKRPLQFEAVVWLMVEPDLLVFGGRADHFVPRVGDPIAEGVVGSESAPHIGVAIPAHTSRKCG